MEGITHGEQKKAVKIADFRLETGNANGGTPQGSRGNVKRPDTLMGF
jgi:hypothetical protein